MIILVAVGAIVLSGQEVKGPSGESLVRNADEYQVHNRRVRDLTFDAFVAADSGKELTEAQKAGLKEALPHLVAMNTYAPIKVGPYFTMGKAQMVLGDYEAAARSFEQAILNQTTDFEENKTDALKVTVLESKALLSECLLKLAVQLRADAAGMSNADAAAYRAKAESYEKIAVQRAAEAVTGASNSPRYLADLAAAYLATGKEKEARDIVLAAMSIDPNNIYVAPLARLMGLQK